MVDICFDNTIIRRILKLQKEYDYNNGRDMGFHFNYGFLEGDPIDTQARMYADALRFYYPDTDEVEQSYRDTKERYDDVIEWLDTVLKNKETIRVWISNTANDMCNLCWLCHYARKCNPILLLVKCPTFEINTQTNIPEFRESWVQVSSTDTFLCGINNAVAMTKDDIDFYASQWERFVKENMPLRILINNNIISTTDDFFDPIILKYIGTEPIALQYVLHDVMDEDLGMSIDFVLSRIESLINQGLVLVCQDNSFGWHRIICRSK